jgi:hypothetical protein
VDRYCASQLLAPATLTDPWVRLSTAPSYTVGEKETCMAAKRVERLKDLEDMLERLPASPDRDRVLSEVRSRAVDLDTGVTPRAMLPVREPAPPLPVLPRPPKRDLAGSITRTASPPPAPTVEVARPAFATAPSKELEQSLCLDERLSLEDSPLPHVRTQGDRAVPPWRLGLRA